MVKVTFVVSLQTNGGLTVRLPHPTDHSSQRLLRKCSASRVVRKAAGDTSIRYDGGVSELGRNRQVVTTAREVDKAQPFEKRTSHMSGIGI